MLIRRLILGVVGLVGLLGASGCPRAGTPPAPVGPRLPVEARTPPTPADRPAVFVDARALPGGDGSASAPFQTVEAALRAAPGRTLHLRDGLHRGPFTLPHGARLEGSGTVVLHVEGLEPVIRAEGALTLLGVTLQGGGWAVEGPGPLWLERVVLSGQREGCLSLAGSSRLEIRESRFEAVVSQLPCVVLGGGAQAHVRGLTLVGPWQQGLSVEGDAQVELQGLRTSGPVTGVRQRGGRVTLRDAVLSGGRGPGVFAAAGVLEVRDVAVEGHEYGLLTGGAARVEGSGLRVRRSERAGLGLVDSTVMLKDVEVSEGAHPGSFGGIQVTGGRATLADVRISGVRSAGLVLRNSDVRLSGLTIRGVEADTDGTEGDGISVRRGRLSLDSARIEDVAGVGLLSAEQATVSARDVEVLRARFGGVAMETGGTLAVERLRVRASQGAAIVGAGEGTATVESLVSEQNAEGAVWADCRGGAQVVLGALHGGQEAPGQPCVLLRTGMGGTGAEHP